MMSEQVKWLSTGQAAKAIGITPRTLYRFIDEGQVRAHRFGRVIRVKEEDLHTFIEGCIIEPGTLAHLYPETIGPNNTHEEE